MLNIIIGIFDILLPEMVLLMRIFYSVTVNRLSNYETFDINILLYELRFYIKLMYNHMQMHTF